MHKCSVVIALGSNLGNSAETLSAASKRIAALPQVELKAMSALYTSEPALVLDQPPFINAVMLIETTRAPKDLLKALQGIEHDFGRVRSGPDYLPYGPRPIDLDIIDYEGFVSDDPELILPHPKALQRDFVVRPLLEISPCHVLANQQVVTTALVNCGTIIFENDSAMARDSSGTNRENKLLHQEACHTRDVPGKLFICATPIGNLGDITLRALDTLKNVSLIYCEDTRVTRKLTAHYAITTPLKRADSHKLPSLLPFIIKQLKLGEQIAYVSDAGMPGISDPGGLLVAEARAAGCLVEVIPGASALTTALAISGIKARQHFFGGFFPRKKQAAKRLLKAVGQLEDTLLVFYESVHRTLKTIQIIAAVYPARRIVMARELTKLYEEVLSGTAEELSTALTQRSLEGKALKGEVVLLIAPPPKTKL